MINGIINTLINKIINTLINEMTNSVISRMDKGFSFSFAFHSRQFCGILGMFVSCFNKMDPLVRYWVLLKFFLITTYTYS